MKKKKKNEEEEVGEGGVLDRKRERVHVCLVVSLCWCVCGCLVYEIYVDIDMHVLFFFHFLRGQCILWCVRLSMIFSPQIRLKVWEGKREREQNKEIV